MASPAATSGGMTFLEVLTVVFIACKLAGCITWSWWWVLAPLWVPICLVLLVPLVVFVFSALFGRK